ncbi:hypothetical protein HYW36_01340, partial [Candidatus Saccharibacteria bacterium]|nr:hypothetical protein [Candidatus Saccharibacteria bacterium]
PTEKEGVDFLNTGLSIYSDGTAHSEQSDMIENGSTGQCVDYETDEWGDTEDPPRETTGVDNPKFGIHIAELLEEAVATVPERQRAFLEVFAGTPEFRLANLMQRFRQPDFVPPGQTLEGASLQDELSAPDFPEWIHPDTFSSSVER